MCSSAYSVTYMHIYSSNMLMVDKIRIIEWRLYRINLLDQVIGSTGGGKNCGRLHRNICLKNEASCSTETQHA